jgi:signal peptidase I
MLSPGCARRVNVSGASMEPTVPAGGHIWVSTIVGTIERGDIVVMRSAEGRDHLRRVVVLPGEVFDIVDGRVRIGGTPLDEPYVLPARRSHERYGPYTVPAGQYFLMGDNRAASLDSRHQGAIPRSQIWARRTW